MLVESQTAAYKIAMQYIEEKIREIKEKDMEVGKEHHSEEDTDFLTHMIHNAKISLEEISINAGDLLGAGVDTVSHWNKAPPIDKLCSLVLCWVLSTKCRLH